MLRRGGAGRAPLPRPRPAAWMSERGNPRANLAGVRANWAGGGAQGRAGWRRIKRSGEGAPHLLERRLGHEDGHGAEDCAEVGRDVDHHRLAEHLRAVADVRNSGLRLREIMQFRFRKSLSTASCLVIALSTAPCSDLSQLSPACVNNEVHVRILCQI